MKKIKGKVVFQNLGMGCWGIVDKGGREWRPVNMPEQLKTTGASVEVMVREADEDMSMVMWGEPVHIVSFSTLEP